MEPAASTATMTVAARRHRLSRPHWSLADIPWRQIRRDEAGSSEALFYMITAASLMESATDLYTANLIEYFAGDDEVTTWLAEYWLPEELQHGGPCAAMSRRPGRNSTGKRCARPLSRSSGRFARTRWKGRGGLRWPRAASSKPAPRAFTPACRAPAMSRCWRR